MSTAFSIEVLRTIYDDDIKSLSYVDYIIQGLIITPDTREEDYVPLIPKTIKYIKNNIYHIETGEYYVTSYNKEQGNYMKLISKDLLENNLYVCYMPPIVKKWWSIYARLYSVVNDSTQELTYVEDDIYYLNIYSGKIKPTPTTMLPIEPKKREKKRERKEENNTLTTYFKHKALTETEDVFNTPVTPADFYIAYIQYHNNINIEEEVLTKNNFLKEIKGLPFIKIKQTRINKKNATNYIYANKKECLTMYEIINEKEEERGKDEIQSIIPDIPCVDVDAHIIIEEEEEISNTVEATAPLFKDKTKYDKYFQEVELEF